MTEVSQMSSMSSMSEMSGTSSLDKPTEGREDERITRVGLIIILLLVMIIGAVYLTRGRGEPVVNNGDDDSGSGDDGKNPDIIVETPPAPTTPFVRRKTTTEGTTSPTPDEIPEPPATDRPVPKPLDPYEDIVLCTISHRALWEEVYPADGICDMLFYTSIRYNSKNSTFGGRYDDYSFDLFKKKANAAGTSAKTSYGASFEYERGQEAASYISKLDTLWNIGIHHYGVLKAWDSVINLTSSNAKLDVLKEVKKQQDTLGPNKRVHRVLGFQVQHERERRQSRTVISYVKQNYPITILITVTHTIGAQFHDYSFGPVSWDSDKSVYSLNVIGGEWKEAKVDDSTWIMASLGMAAATWKIDKDLYDTTTYFSDGRWRILWWNPSLYEQTCIEGGGALDDQGHYMYKGVWSNQLLVTWDTRDTMLKKMNDFFFLLKTLPKKHGWALYDVDYDDPHNKCKMGSFPRVKQISRFMHL